MHRLLGILLCLGFFVGLPARAAAAEPEETGPKAAPGLQVEAFLDRDSLRPGGTGHLDVWIVNPSDLALSRTVLHVVAPPFLELRRGSCTGAPLGRDLVLGPMEPRSLLHRHFCVKAGYRIREGETRLTLLVEHAWPRPDREEGVALLTVEEPVQIGIFGTGEVGGVSIGVIALILPGLLFFQILRLRGVGWAVSLEDFPMATLSIVFSVLLQLVTQWGSEGLTGPVELLGACLLSVILAWIVASAWKAYENRKDTKIAEGESTATVLRKLIRQYPDATAPKAILTLADGSRLEGSLAAYTEKGAVILGSYRVDVNQLPVDLQSAAQKLADAGNLFDLALWVEQNGIDLQSEYDLQQVDPKGGTKSLRGPLFTDRKEVKDLKADPAGGYGPPLALSAKTAQKHQSRSGDRP